MTTITITSKSSVADAINEYVNRGFGSMTKNDFEVWIFYQLLLDDRQRMSNYDYSVKLRIPESKVKRLCYEASLKYGNPTNTAQYNQAFQSLLANVNLKKGTKGVIQFAVEDMQLRKYLESILKKKGRFADTLLNTEVVSITLDDLAILLDETCTKEQKEEIVKKAKEKEPFIKIVKKALEKVVEIAVETGVTTGLKIGATALANLLR